jgi:hypothetical protein
VLIGYRGLVAAQRLAFISGSPLFPFAPDKKRAELRELGSLTTFDEISTEIIIICGDDGI